MKGNCLTGCKHCSIGEIYETVEYKDSEGKTRRKNREYLGNKEFCSGGHQEEYDAWHERNHGKTHEEYSEDTLPCFEPILFIKALNDANDGARKILEKLKRKK